MKFWPSIAAESSPSAKAKRGLTDRTRRPESTFHSQSASPSSNSRSSSETTSLRSAIPASAKRENKKLREASTAPIMMMATNRTAMHAISKLWPSAKDMNMAKPTAPEKISVVSGIVGMITAETVINIAMIVHSSSLVGSGAWAAKTKTGKAQTAPLTAVAKAWRIRSRCVSGYLAASAKRPLWLMDQNKLPLRHTSQPTNHHPLTDGVNRPTVATAAMTCVSRWVRAQAAYWAYCWACIRGHSPVLAGQPSTANTGKSLEGVVEAVFTFTVVLIAAQSLALGKIPH